MAFHPTRSNVFALGFQDGTVAAYDATVVPTSQENEERYSFARIYGEIAHILRLHEPVPGSPLDLQDYSFRNDSPTISAIHFLAGQACSVVTTGLDGKCCVVRFEKAGVNASKVIAEWHLNSPATSLAVLRAGYTIELPQADGVDDTKSTTAASSVLFAIGKSDGTVGIYNQTGELLAFRDFSKDGRILDLEWMEKLKDSAKIKHGQGDLPRSGSEPEPAIQPLNRATSVPLLVNSPEKSLRSSRSSIGSKIMIKLHTKEPPPDDYLLGRQRSMQNIVEESNESRASGLDGNTTSILKGNTMTEEEESRPVPGDFDPERGNEGNHIQFQDINDVLPVDMKQQSRHSSYTTISSRGSRKSGKKSRMPAIPSRPVPRPGGRLALRRMETAKGRRPSTCQQSIVPKEIVRAVSTGQPKFKAIDHTAFARPRTFRHRSSLVSPLSDISEPYATPMTYMYSRTPSIIDELHDQRSQLAPLQYDRLVRTSWDTESGNNTSHSSGAAVSDRRFVTPIKKRLVAPEAIRLGRVPQAKPNRVEGTTIVPGSISDSGTSASSVLDWTPGQIQQPAYIPRGAPATSTSASPRGPLRPKSVALDDRPPPPPPKKNRNSDASSVGRLDWHIDSQPVRQVSIGNINREQPIQTSIPGGNQVMSINADDDGISSVPLADRALSFNIPLLRKQETVINLKDKRREFLHPDTQPPPPPAAAPPTEPLTHPKPHSSLPESEDPQAPKTANKSTKLPPGTRLASVAFSAPQGSATTRRSSHFKAMMDMPQFQSGSTVGSQSMYTIEDVIRIECAAICARIDGAFEEQRGWLEERLKDQNWYTQRLEEENRRFREELARLRR